LASRNYQHVEVFCSDGVCRSNLGRWKVRTVPVGTRDRDFKFYSAKDRAMTRQATVGFMVWDGKSTGTLLNVVRLLREQKKVVVYVVPKGMFAELKSDTEWDDFIADYDLELQRKVERRASLEASEKGSAAQTSLAL
jgi:hypothetical protein